MPIFQVYDTTRRQHRKGNKKLSSEQWSLTEWGLKTICLKWFIQAVCLILEGAMRTTVRLWCRRFLSFSSLAAKCNTTDGSDKTNWDQQSQGIVPCHLWSLQNKPFLEEIPPAQPFWSRCVAPGRPRKIKATNVPFLRAAVPAGKQIHSMVFPTSLQPLPDQIVIEKPKLEENRKVQMNYWI